MEIDMGCPVGDVVENNPTSPEFLHHLAFELFRKKDDPQICQPFFHLLKHLGRPALPEPCVIFRHVQGLYDGQEGIHAADMMLGRHIEAVAAVLFVLIPYIQIIQPV